MCFITKREAPLRQSINIPFENENNLCLWVNAKGMVTKISINDIILIKAESNYSTIFLINGKKVLTSKTLKFWADKLDTVMFIRIHASYLINKCHVLEMHRAKRVVVMAQDLQACISRRTNSKIQIMLNN
jgi:two-component system, LytTR family, response regulator